MSDPSVHPTIAEANGALAMRLPFADRTDFEDARRGWIASLSDPIIRAGAGRVVWDVSAYDFLDADCPPTANPSLWRQSQLAAIHGLFEVAEGIYQVRGLDLSNMTIVEGESGVIVIDPLISSETAAAALALYREHRGDRPVNALIYTHSHVDHFGGARGVIDDADLARGIPVIAPEGFLEHAVSENVLAGTAMVRRAAFMYGAALEKGPAGQIGAGLGQTTSTGTVTLIAPTVEISATGQTLELDGVPIEFQLTPGTEAPAEMNFYFPDRRALCIAENATHNLHNVLTLRGALVRDASVWAHYLDEAIELFAGRTDVMFAQHHWPCWGETRIRDFLAKQRDLYGYLHDQTLRMINRGMTGTEIAEAFELPDSLDLEWHLRGYYGTVSHNVKAIYQRYMGWFDGNPAHLWQHPPVAAAERYVKLAGGAESAITAAREAYEVGDLRWAAELLSHVLFADPQNADARELQAQVLEQLAFGSESGPWRNFFLTGAYELRHGPVGSPSSLPPDFVKELSTEQVFSAIAVRVNGMKAAARNVRTIWVFPDTGEKRTANLENGVLTHRDGANGEADVTITVDRASLNELIAAQASVEQLAGEGKVKLDGDASALAHLFGSLEEPDPSFAILTP